MNLSITLVSIITLAFGLFSIFASIILAETVNKIFQFRIAPMVLGIIGLIVFVFGKYIWYIIDVVNNTPSPSFNDYFMDNDLWNINKITNLFLVKIPDLLLLVLSLSLIFDKTKNFTKAIAPYGLFFGILYLVCSSFSYTATSYTTSIEWYEFLFVSDGMTRMPSITFILVSLMSLWMIITCKEYSRWSIASSFLLGAIIIVYTSTVQIFYDIGANGLTLLGYQGLFNPVSVTTFFPNYFVPMASMFGLDSNPDNIIYARIFILSLYFVFPILIFTFKNLFTRDIRRVNYIYKPWYYKSLLFKAPCYWIDGTINNILEPIFRNAYLYGIMSKDVKKIRDFLSYTEQNPQSFQDVERSKLSDMAKKMEEKELEKLRKKQSKQAQKDIYNFDDDIMSNPVNDSNINNILSTNIVQEWKDESGTTWGLDANGKYFYKSDGKWLAYQ